MKDVGRWFYALVSVFMVTHCQDLAKEDVDRVLEDELTQKLCNDLLQSIERKFQVDLERSVDMVLVKIKLLLQNGTLHIQDKLVDLQGQLDDIKKTSETEVEACLNDRQNETSALAEKALHQMVVCGYALIGHDPAQAVRKVMNLKTMINTGLKPLYDQKKEVLSLLKVCGHDHDSLKKVIKCVISKSPVIKTSMMDISGKLIDGVVSLTKLMAHGAMHEACLIEVIKTTEDEAFKLVRRVKNCVHGNDTGVQEEVDNYIKENNATILDIDFRGGNPEKSKEDNENEKENKDMKEILRRILKEDNMDKKLKKKLAKLQEELGTADNDINMNKI